MKKDTLRKEIEALDKNMGKLVLPDDENYEVRAVITHDGYEFDIKHKTRNWNRFVTVRITTNGEASFSHSTGGWQNASQDEVMEATLKCFEIAKSIMDRRAELGAKAKEIHLLQNKLIEAIRVKEENEKIELLKSLKTELEDKHEKIDVDTAYSIIRSKGRIDFADIVNWGHGINELKIGKLIIKDFGDKGRINLHLLQEQLFSDDTVHLRDRGRITKKDFEDIVKSTYLFVENQTA